MAVTLIGEKVKIYASEKSWSGGTFMTYSMGIASKDKNGNWVNGYVDCSFKKDDAAKITNKCKINIKNAFPTVTESNGKKYVKWFINDFEVVEAGESASVSPEDFMAIPDSIDEELPFK